jgi:integrase
MAKRRGNGEGTITKNLQRGRWEGRITVGIDEQGRAVRRKVTGRTRDEVLTRLRDASDSAATGQERARRDFTVGRFLDSWLDDTLPGSVAKSTEQQYRDIVRLYIKPHVGRRKLLTLNARDVDAMLAALEREGRAPNTRRLARSVLRRALRRAEQEGLIDRNAAAVANGVRLGSTEGRTLTPEQARALLVAVENHRLGAAFTVAVSLGLRRGELLGLTWDDVDLEATPPRLTVRRAIHRLRGQGLVLADTKTKGSRRTVYLPAPAADALRAHRRRQAEERLKAGPLWTARPLGADLVFRTPDGTALDPDNFRQLTYTVTEAAGLGRWSPHELRHSAASLLLAQGVRLEVVSETLGHASIRITKDVYGHLLEPAKVEAADAMTALLGG